MYMISITWFIKPYTPFGLNSKTIFSTWFTAFWITKKNMPQNFHYNVREYTILTIDYTPETSQIPKGWQKTLRFYDSVYVK